MMFFLCFPRTGKREEDASEAGGGGGLFVLSEKRGVAVWGGAFSFKEEGGGRMWGGGSGRVFAASGGGLVARCSATGDNNVAATPACTATLPRGNLKCNTPFKN